MKIKHSAFHSQVKRKSDKERRKHYGFKRERSMRKPTQKPMRKKNLDSGEAVGTSVALRHTSASLGLTICLTKLCERNCGHFLRTAVWWEKFQIKDISQRDSGKESSYCIWNILKSGRNPQNKKMKVVKRLLWLRTKMSTACKRGPSTLINYSVWWIWRCVGGRGRILKKYLSNSGLWALLDALSHQSIRVCNANNHIVMNMLTKEHQTSIKGLWRGVVFERKGLSRLKRWNDFGDFFARNKRVKESVYQFLIPFCYSNKSEK